LRILYLEDEPVQAELARRWLESEGHFVQAHARGGDAIKAVERDSFDVAILDWMVPDISGEEVLRWIRRRRPDMPVLFATSQDDEKEIVHILELGADDYLVKPLRRAEFVTRVKALGRRLRAPAEARGVLELPPYRIDPVGRTVHKGGREIKMTPRMADLAMLLFSKRGELVSRAEIYQQVWGHLEQQETRTVDTHVSRLRSALELDGTQGWKLVSIYQHGYRMEPPASGEES
jgi:DNA-binding response OmpR family regulator